MKKLLSLVLAMLMLVTVFAGCSGTPNTDDTKKVELSRGTVEGNVYKSEFLGLQFTKPEGWVYSTDEEIAFAMGLGKEFLEGDLKKTLDNSASVYDMMVVDSITRTNMSIGFENLSKSFSSNMTEKQYVDTLKSQLQGLSGMTVTFSDELTTVKLGEHDYTKAVATTVASGITMTQVYYLRKIDNYMAFAIVTIVSGYTAEDIEAMFK